jgi:very-short-patch-repair endonuclease/predicted transcriptional regulator of viral defense system
MSTIPLPLPRAHVNKSIAEIAARQHGIVTYEQLLACGLSRSAIARRVQAGVLFAIHPGTYAVGDGHMTYERQVVAACLATGPAAAAFGLCALRLYGIGRWSTAPVEVVTARRHRRLRGASTHFTRRLQPRDVTMLRNVPVTSMARTIVDLAEVLDEYQLAFVIHRARYRRFVTLRALDDAALLHRTRHGHPVLVAALALHRSGSAGTRSGAEDSYRALLLRGGIDAPLVNVHAPVPGGSYELDFQWPDVKLNIEIDNPGHDLPAQRIKDDERDRILRENGWTIVRIPLDCLEAGVEIARRQLELLRTASTGGCV